MGKAGFVLALMVVTLFVPVSAAQTACVPVVGSCVDVTAEDGVYVCERAASQTACAVRGQAGAEGASYDNILVPLPVGGAISRNHAHVEGTHANATSNGNWGRMSLDATQDGTRLCSITLVGATAQMGCLDTRQPPALPTDPDVWTDAVESQVAALLNDPLVRCVMGQPCIV